jgi:hypothetical protein
MAQGAALRRLRGGAEKAEGRVALVRGQLFRQRVALDGIEGRLRQRQVASEVGQIAAVVLTHEEKLLRVAENGGADA